MSQKLNRGVHLRTEVVSDQQITAQQPGKVLFPLSFSDIWLYPYSLRLNSMLPYYYLFSS